MQKKVYPLKKVNRLKSKKSFQFVYSKGRPFVDGMSVFYILSDQGENVKLGLAVGKKLGCAVIRNHTKRLMREVFRKHKDELKKGTHIIWMARRRLVQAELTTYERVFVKLVKKAALLQNKDENEQDCNSVY